MVGGFERRADETASEGAPEKSLERMKSDAGEEQRPSRSIGQRVRDLRRLQRELQEKDARKERASAKKAEAAERKKDREEMASAKEFCRQLAANWSRPRSKAVVTSEAELLALGGVKTVVWHNDGLQTRIIFGGAGETQLTFTPYKGAWKIELEPKEPKETLEELKRELRKAGKGLWDNDKNKPDIAYQAAEGLLYCFDWFKGLPSDERQAAHVQIAIVATLQALERDAKTKARRLQLAFKLLTDPQWLGQIGKLLDHARMLACELQRPPYKWELRKDFDPQERIQTTNFAMLLRRAGLGWLPKKPR